MTIWSWVGVITKIVPRSCGVLSKLGCFCSFAQEVHEHLNKPCRLFKILVIGPTRFAANENDKLFGLFDCAEREISCPNVLYFAWTKGTRILAHSARTAL